MFEKTPSWYTLNDFSTLAQCYGDYTFIIEGTGDSPSFVASWRGAYDQPAIVTSSSPVTGDVLWAQIQAGLECEHEGYKGGHYWYSGSQVFRLVNCVSSSDNLSVYGYKIDTGKKTIELIVGENEY